MAKRIRKNISASKLGRRGPGSVGSGTWGETSPGSGTSPWTNVAPYHDHSDTGTYKDWSDTAGARVNKVGQVVNPVTGRLRKLRKNLKK